MLTDDLKKEYYQALLDKNTEYEGVFFVGVKTTGVFCRPSCPARKPKFENCEFFETAQKALLASFRPCMRCKPLSHPKHVSYFVLVDVNASKILLVDHKKAGLWLPAGGHVELNEHPKETVKREILEELQIPADFLLQDPLFVTVTQTVGETAGHTDVSFWYVLQGDSERELRYDLEEFYGVYWFRVDEIPYERTDPHLKRFIQKLQQAKILRGPESGI